MKKRLHIWDLSKDTTWILLKHEYKSELFEELSKYFSDEEASIKLNITKPTFRCWRRMEMALPLWLFIRIFQILSEIDSKNSMQELEQHILAYKHKGGKFVYNPQLPIELETKEFAIICAAFLCDGSINDKGDPSYNNSEFCMRKRLVESIRKSIGELGVKPAKPYENNCIFFPRILKDILMAGFNMQSGDKVLNNPVIPSLFLKTNKPEIIGAFLNQAFSDDGSAHISQPHSQGALSYGESRDVTELGAELREEIKDNNIDKYCANLVRGCKKLLEKLEIKANGPYCKREYIRNDTDKQRRVHSWGIQIQGRRNIQRFRDLVGFNIARKNCVVNQILKNYKEIEYGTSFVNAKEIIRNLARKNAMINIDTFAAERKCTKQYSRQLLCALRKEGIIERIGGGINHGICGVTPYEYKLVEE